MTKPSNTLPIRLCIDCLSIGTNVYYHEKSFYFSIKDINLVYDLLEYDFLINTSWSLKAQLFSNIYNE